MFYLGILSLARWWIRSIVQYLNCNGILRGSLEPVDLAKRRGTYAKESFEP